MKKKFIYLSLAFIIITLQGTLQGTAMEEDPRRETTDILKLIETVRTLRAENLSLRDYIANKENEEEKGVIAQSLQEIPDLSPEGAQNIEIPNPIQIVHYSIYQTPLLPLWTDGKIGPDAWKRLGGSNPSLAKALLSAIQGCAGAHTEIFNLENRNFTLRVNGKGQKKPYRF